MFKNKPTLYAACPMSVIGFVLGCLVVQFAKALPTIDVLVPYTVITGIFTVIIWAFTAFSYGEHSLDTKAIQLSDRKVFILLIANLFLTGLFGMGWAAYEGHQRTTDGFPTQLEGKDLTVVGYISHLPKLSVQSQQVLLVIERIEADSPVQLDTVGLENTHLNGKTIALGWYQPRFNLKPAQQYRLTFRAKQRHGSLNPHGFDYEQWLVSRGIAATGYIRGVPEDLGTYTLKFLPWVERIRDSIRTQVFLISPNQAAARWVSALALGDQSSLDDTEWQRYNRTGTGHLLAVSGTHIALMGALLAWLAGYFWRANPTCLLRIPLQTVRLNILLFSSLVYALIAGWGLPAQRTVFMLCTAWVAKKIMTHASMYHVMAVAAGIALLREPMAVILPSFCLSYGAVAVLIAVEWRHKTDNDADLPLQTTVTTPTTRWHQYYLMLRQAAHTQWVLTLALIPLTALFFNQTSLISPLANAIAIPIMGWISTPIALLAAVLSGVWQSGAMVLMDLLLSVQTFMEWVLDTLLSIPYASVYVPSTPRFWQLFGVLAAIGSAFLTRYRLLGYGAVILFIVGSFGFTAYQSWSKSAWRVVFLDVGQGMAVLVQSQGRTLLFDTGPSYGSDSDAAERVIVPYLRATGVYSLDHVILSHADEDHSGGVRSLLAQMPIKQWWYSLAPSHPLLTALPVNRLPCQSGQQVLWAGLNLEFLHPPVAIDFANRNTNSVSCVLKITAQTDDKKQYSVLLTGDIESAQELSLVEEYDTLLRSAILLSPHHGSKTSSKTEFLNAVNPQHVVIQNGYRNRYGHPHPSVSQRYADAGIQQWRSDRDGAVIFDIDATASQPIQPYAWRVVAQRYWHTVLSHIN